MRYINDVTQRIAKYVCPYKLDLLGRGVEKCEVEEEYWCLRKQAMSVRHSGENHFTR
jgi:hypothetical protein